MIAASVSPHGERLWGPSLIRLLGSQCAQEQGNPGAGTRVVAAHVLDFVNKVLSARGPCLSSPQCALAASLFNCGAG